MGEAEPESEQDGTGVEQVKLSGPLNVVGITNKDFEENEIFAGCVSMENLKRAVELLDTLGWDKVDVCHVPDSADDSNDLIVLRPGPDVFGNENSAVCVAPLTDKGRCEGFTNDI